MSYIEGHRFYEPKPRPLETDTVIDAVNTLYEQAQPLNVLDGVALVHSSEAKGLWQTVYLVPSMDFNFRSSDPAIPSDQGKQLFALQLRAFEKVHRRYPEVNIGAQFLVRNSNSEYPLQKYIEEQLTPPQGLEPIKVTTVFCKFYSQPAPN